jgi:hypothetical protein
MPYYTFECTDEKCKCVFDMYIDSFSTLEKDGPPPCEKCQKPTIKIFSPDTNIRFIGLPTPTHQNPMRRYPKNFKAGC